MKNVIGFERAACIEDYAWIGRRIIASNPIIYNEKVKRLLHETVKRNFPNYSEDQLMNVLYQSVYCYWAYGALIDEFFSYRLYEKTLEEASEYITAHIREVYLKEKLSCIEDAHLLENKFEAYKLLKPYYHRDVILLEGEKDYDLFKSFVTKHSEFVVKPADENLARGIHKTDVIGLDENGLNKAFHGLLDEGVRAREQYDYGKEKSVVLEEILVQVPEMASMHPASVNGVRATTVRVGGKVTLYHPWMKIGNGGNFVTSGAIGSMVALIDEETGIVISPGFTEFGERFKFHPDSNVRIEGFKIPKWRELVDTVTELAFQLPTIGYVGWDMVLTKDGWTVMEGNFRGEPLWQLLLQKGMRQEFENLIEWHMKKEYWWEY